MRTDGIPTINGVGLIPDLRNSSQFRSNAGFLNFGEEPCTVYWQLVGHVGAATEGQTQAVPAYGWVQISDVFGKAGVGAWEHAWMNITAQGGPVWAYGSVVDNGSNDPTSLPMVKLMP